MSTLTLITKSLGYHWRTNLAVMLGAVIGCAVLAGALVVGDSIRGSLRDMAIERLGRVDYALQSSRFFSESLAQRIGVEACPAILYRGSAAHADTRRLANSVNVIAAEASFWSLGRGPPIEAPDGDQVVLNQSLADELGAARGDEILLRVPSYSAIPSESLLGSRDEPFRTLRLTVATVIPDRDLGRFSLRSNQQITRNAYVALSRLQRALRQPERVNTILMTANPRINEALIQQAATLDDLGLKIVRNTISTETGRFEYASVESTQMVLSTDAEHAVMQAARRAGLAASPVLTYLANTIRLAGQTDDARVVPYSVVSAIDWPREAFPAPVVASGSPSDSGDDPPPVDISDWLAERLDAAAGDRIEISYYMLDPGGALRTEYKTLRVANIVRLEGAAADSGLTPDYPGVSSARSMTDWDPPFPVDYSLIGSDDEAYWDAHRTTPKAFVPLSVGQEMWANERDAATRFGRLTSIRLAAPSGGDLDELLPDFERLLKQTLGFQQTGLALRAVKSDNLTASAGATDFGGLFIGFSMFLIGSAALLVVLLFRLAVEQRSRQIGLLLALGFTPTRVRRLLLCEGLVIAAAAGVVAVPVAVAYAWLMLAGLRTLWQSAVGTSLLTLHVSALTLILGSLIGVALSAAAILWAVRSVARRPVTSLLSGAISHELEPTAALRKPMVVRRRVMLVSLGGALACLGISFLVEGAARAGLFFGCGGLLLVGLLTRVSMWAAAGDTRMITGGAFAIARLGVRNALRRPDRTTLTVSLIACATFLVVAVGASRHQPRFDPANRNSGHGGFALIAQADVPVLADLNSAAARSDLAFDRQDEDLFEGVEIFPLRSRPGDDASCLNLYKPQQPSLIGATPELIERGGFAFAGTLETVDNPWRLLEADLGEDVVPVFADNNTATWLLHLGLGDDFIIRDDRGDELHLRLVGKLSTSIFQSELIMSERKFLEHFPRTSGYGMFLIDVPQGVAADLSRALEASLSDFGFDVTPTVDRIKAYLEVENTYLSTFQLLGGLGLLLGTFGIAAVLLRNIIERRGELALLSAVGFRRPVISRMILSETVLLIAVGVGIGAIAALVAVAPNALTNARQIPWLSLAVTLAAIIAAGTIAAATAVRAALRTSLIDALRAG